LGKIALSRATIEKLDRGGGAVVLRAAGILVNSDSTRLRRAALGLLDRGDRNVEIDLAAIESLDGGAAATIVDLASVLRSRDVEVCICGATGRALAILDLYGAHDRPRSRRGRPAPIGLLDHLGRSTARVGATARHLLGFLGDLTVALLESARWPRSVNWREIPELVERIGADGVYVVGITCFLTGVILAFQSAVTLEKFGATAVVSDVVALSLMRELAPLMAAVVVTGRTGAAFAAELGTMKVSDEIDALRTLGLPPVNFLVIPRVLALMLCLPLLTMFANVTGLAGGYLVGVTWLEIPPVAYLNETQRIIHVSDALLGARKSLAFAAAIALVSCEHGLAVRGGAEGVGKGTTRAVVTTIFTLVLIDAVFAISPRLMGP
jgi:phospholipid/cholesterol/gamma-HCH transport system permease protein